MVSAQGSFAQNSLQLHVGNRRPRQGITNSQGSNSSSDDSATKNALNGSLLQFNTQDSSSTDALDASDSDDADQTNVSLAQAPGQGTGRGAAVLADTALAAGDLAAPVSDPDFLDSEDLDKREDSAEVALLLVILLRVLQGSLLPAFPRLLPELPAPPLRTRDRRDARSKIISAALTAAMVRACTI